MTTIGDVLEASADYLAKQGVPKAKSEAQWLVADALEMGRMEPLLKIDQPLQEKELEALRSNLRRRGKREPRQYIRGIVEFLDCSIVVDSDVLIPRQETEVIAERMFDSMKEFSTDGKQFLDLCCGSGCVGIAAKRHFPGLHVTLSDLSEKALAVAKSNATKNKTDVLFLEGDFLLPLKEKDLIVDFLFCNPPYISATEYDDLEPEVRDFEPKLALVGKEEGMEFYRRLSEEIDLILAPQGKLWLEIGASQAEEVEKLFLSKGRTGVWKDWTGNDRCFFLEKE